MDLTEDLTELFYETFNEYCERNNKIYRLYYDDDLPELRILKDKIETTIAKCFIQVTDIYILKKRLVICYELEMDEKVTDEILERTIIFDVVSNFSVDSTHLDSKEINTLVKDIKRSNPYLINNDKIFKKAIMEYIIFALKIFIEANATSSCKVGWHLNKNGRYVFSGVTHEALGKPTPIDETLFQIKDFDFENLVKDNELYLLEDIENPSKYERHCLIQESMEIVLKELNKNPDLCVLFAYDVLALTYNFFDDNPDIKRFPIAVCGNGNAAMAKIVANVFCNMQHFDPSRPNTIAKDTNIQHTSIFCKLDDYVCYADITMLMPVSGGLYKRKDHTLIKIISDTMLDEINYFPVFVTDKESKIMEIIEVDVSKFKNFPCERNSKELIDLKVSINRLLLEYILFNYRAANSFYGKMELEDMDNLIKTGITEQEKNFKNLKNLNLNVEDQYLLYIKALNYLYQFLKINSCEALANSLNQLCFKVFQMRASDWENTPSEDNIVIEKFRNYILAIFENKELNPNYFYIEGVEKRGKKETCYYLDFNKFYPHFLDVNPEISIDERGLLRILKSFGLIKTKDDTSYGVERKFEGIEKKIYVLAVLKEKINII